MVASLSAFAQLSQLGASPSTNKLTLRGTGQQYFAPTQAPQRSSGMSRQQRTDAVAARNAANRAASKARAAASAARGRAQKPAFGSLSSSSFKSLSSRQSITTPRAGAQPTPQMTKEIQQGLQGLIKGFRSASGKARSANEARYAKLLKENKLFGSRRRAEISGEFAQREQQIGAQQQQRLQAQGMAGTTVGSTLAAGLGRDIERERQSAFTQLGEQMRATRAGIIERRQDIGPDPAALSSIIGGLAGQFGAKGLPTFLKAFQGLQV